MRKAKRNEYQNSRLIDFVIIGLVMYLFTWKVLVTLFLIPIASLVYFPLMHALFSRSIGDLMLRLKLVDSKGSRISISLAFMRLFAYISNLIFYSGKEAIDRNPLINDNKDRNWVTKYAKYEKEMDSHAGLQWVYDKYEYEFEKDSGTFLVKCTNGASGKKSRNIA